MAGRKDSYGVDPSEGQQTYYKVQMREYYKYSANSAMAPHG